MNWFPEAEHGGYYAALAEGFYQEAGLNVKILPGGPDTPVLQQVAGRAVSFGVANADNLLLGRGQQMPVVAVMAPLQLSPRCIMVHESSGIREFDDLKNITIEMSNSNPFSYFLRKKLPLEGVKVVPYSGNVALFLQHKNYAQQAYVFSEPFVARKEGGDPEVLMLSELGFNPYTSVLFTSDERDRRQRPPGGEDGDRLGPRLGALRQVARVSQQADSQTESRKWIWTSSTTAPKRCGRWYWTSAAEEHGIGTMSRGRWQTLAEQLVETDQLKPDAVDVNQVFTTKFLPEAR